MKYLIIGNGRVGAAFAAYCRYLGHEAAVWSRLEVEGSPEALASSVAEADVLAIATPDSAIQLFWENYRMHFEGLHAIHFSGALNISGMRSCHPLYSFPKAPLGADKFASIAIAIEEGGPTFAEVLPGANNPTLVVKIEDRAFYHALAVISGNYVAHIWNDVAARFEKRFNVDAGAALAPYFQSVVERFHETPLSSVTGPVVRKDRTTVEANLRAIEGDADINRLYREFLEKAWSDFPAD